MRRLTAVARHIAAGGSSGATTERLEQRLGQLQREKDQLQLELGAAEGVDVPRSFFRTASLDDAAAFFRRNGYWIMEDAVAGDVKSGDPGGFAKNNLWKTLVRCRCIIQIGVNGPDGPSMGPCMGP